MTLRRRRKMAGLTMRQLGEMVGVSEASISMYETGRHKPKVRIAKRIAKILHCSWTELIDDDDEAV